MRRLIFLSILLISQSGCENKRSVITIGFVPWVPYAQALVGFGRRDFQETFSGKPLVLPYALDETGKAGKELLAKNIDLAYMDSVEAIRLCVQTKGEFVMVSGAAVGGGALVIDKALSVKDINDLSDKQIATPPAGCLYNAMAKAYFAELGFVPVVHGGKFLLSAIPEDLRGANFLEKEISAFWTGEPWVSYLVEENGAHIYSEGSDLWRQWTGTDAPTVVLVARASLLKKFPAIVEGIVKVHSQLTTWINENPQEAAALCRRESERLTGKTWSEKTHTAAWNRLEFTLDIPMLALNRQALYSWRIGLIDSQVPDMAVYVSGKQSAKALNQGKM